MTNVTYSYICVCGKEPMSGDLKTSAEAAKVMFQILDEAWLKDHSGPNCTPLEQAKTVTSRSKRSDK